MLIYVSTIKPFENGRLEAFIKDGTNGSFFP